MNFELIDRIQDIISIPVMIYLVWQLHQINKKVTKKKRITNKKGNKNKK